MPAPATLIEVNPGAFSTGGVCVSVQVKVPDTPLNASVLVTGATISAPLAEGVPLTTFDGNEVAEGVPLTALDGRELVTTEAEGVPDATFDGNDVAEGVPDAVFDGRDIVEGVGTDGVPLTTFDGDDVAEDVPDAVLDGRDAGIVGISA